MLSLTMSCHGVKYILYFNSIVGEAGKVVAGKYALVNICKILRDTIQNMLELNRKT